MCSTPNTAEHFGLSDRALRFARLYAKHSAWSAAECARQAGFADTARAAKVRAAELMRDPRVVRAILHFGGLAFSRAQAAATARLETLAEGGDFLSYRDRVQLKNLAAELDGLKATTNRLNQLVA